MNPLGFCDVAKILPCEFDFLFRKFVQSTEADFSDVVVMDSSIVSA